MRVKRRSALLLALSFALSWAFPVAFGDAGEQAAGVQYPDRAITLVVPFIAGGPVDVIANVVADALSAQLGQSVVVTSVAGSGGTRGAAQVARAAPDGYTLLFHHIGMAAAPALYPGLPFDVKHDFEEIGLIGTSPMVVLGRRDLGATDVPALLDLLRRRGTSVTLGHAGPGSASHLCGMLLMSRLSTALTTVTYQGTAPALKDLVGGQTDVMCDLATNALGAVRDGSVNGYAVTTAAAVVALPGLPPLAASGLDGFDLTNWYGLYVPAHTSEEVRGRLSAALAECLGDGALVARLMTLGVDPIPVAQRGAPAHRQFLQEQIDVWTPLIRAAGAYAD